MPECIPIIAPARDERINYLHFHDALTDLVDLQRHFASQQSVRLQVAHSYLKQLGLPTFRSHALSDVLDFLSNSRGKRLSLAKLRRAVSHSQLWRQRFQALGCRGFSFSVAAAPRFHCQGFTREITLKTALLTDPHLYYPPRVRQALHELPQAKQHVWGSVGWMLGQERQVENRTWLYIVNIQSDLTSLGPSCLREVFRGWQRVLFWNVLKLARCRGVMTIAIPPANALAHGSSRGAARVKHVDAWQPLYDGVASFFNMRNEQCLHRINVQPMLFLPPRWCSAFFVGDVDQLWSRFGSTEGAQTRPAGQRGAGEAAPS